MRCFLLARCGSLFLTSSLLVLGCSAGRGPDKSSDGGTGSGAQGPGSGGVVSGGGPGSGGIAPATGGTSPASGGDPGSGGGGAPASGGAPHTGGDVPASGGVEPGTGGTSGSPTGGMAAAGSGGVPSSGGVVLAGNGGAAAATSVGGNGGAGALSATGGLATGGVVDREQAPYPEADPSDCGAWRLVDNVCCAQYCVDDDRSESCSECGGNDSQSCVAVDAKACKSGKWPEETHTISDDEPWHYSRSTHFGLTAAGACAYGLYSLCSAKIDLGAEYQERCDAFCTAYPDLCADPEGVTLRGNYAAPQGNYYTQFWPGLPGDRDNYLACGECFEMIHTRPDGSEYQPGDEGYTPPVVVQIVDSCPCSANSKWCCGAGRNHCGEVSDFEYGCPLPPGPPNPPADRDPLAEESIHLDLSSIAMARLQTGDPNGFINDGVIPTRYRRVPCPVVGNTYLWLHPAGGEYWFSLSVVNSAGQGSIVSVEAQLPSGEWVAMERDQNYTSSRPQERYGSWVLPQGEGPFELPVSIRLTSPSGEAIVAQDVIKSWEPADAAMRETYYIDTGVQFE